MSQLPVSKKKCKKLKEEKTMATRLIMSIILSFGSVHIGGGWFFYFPLHKQKVEGKYKSHLPIYQLNLEKWTPRLSENHKKRGGGGEEEKHTQLSTEGNDTSGQVYARAASCWDIKNFTQHNQRTSNLFNVHLCQITKAEKCLKKGKMCPSYAIHYLSVV